MRICVQKCSCASVRFGESLRSIEKGLVVFVGFTEGDSLKEIQYLARKVAHLRIFEDENGVMNLSVLDILGSVLSISQFTLYGDVSHGNRPSYKNALASEKAKELYSLWNQELAKYVSLKEGFFGEEMIVSLDNIGPTTIWLEKS